MKKTTKRCSAVIAAAIMTFSMFGTAQAYGWEETENGTKYIRSDGEEAKAGMYNIGGVIYKFSEEGYCVGKFSGWAKSKGVKRRYHEGVPYTGWLKTSGGPKEYCLDGYLVTGTLQIGDQEYIFNDEGHLSGQTGLAISADCGKVTADTDIITIKLTMLQDGAQSFGAPAMLEKWEKGEWVDCFADLDGAVPATMELYSMSKKGETLEVKFYSLERTDYKLTPGFYRIPINNAANTGLSFAVPIAVIGDDGKVSPVKPAETEPTAETPSTYAMFEVVSGK